MNTENRLPLASPLSAAERVCGYVRLDSRQICRTAGCIPGFGGVLFDRWPRQCSHRVLTTGRNLIMVLLLAAVHTARASTNGQLLMWFDVDRPSAMHLVPNKFQQVCGLPLRI